jgi:hypothetical protein
MQIIPVITMEKREITEKQSEILKKLLDESDSQKPLYILDLYGINKDKPNLCTYQKLSKDFNLWVDSGPRNLGDVVDVFMAGANAITLRKNIWPNIDVSSIREISENKVYINLDKDAIEEVIFYNSDGIINFSSKEEIEKDFKYEHKLKTLISKNNVYAYENDAKNLIYWKTYGIKNLLVDIEKIGEFKRYEF